MSEDWAGIADEVAAALSDVGPYEAVLVRPAAESDDDAGTPWGNAATGAAADPSEYPVTVLDKGTKVRYARDPQGALIPRTVRAFLVSATGERPMIGDILRIDGVDHVLTAADAVSPTGVALLYKIDVAV